MTQQTLIYIFHDITTMSTAPARMMVNKNLCQGHPNNSHKGLKTTGKKVLIVMQNVEQQICFKNLMWGRAGQVFPMKA